MNNKNMKKEDVYLSIDDKGVLKEVLKKDYFTLKALFSDMNIADRARIGQKVHKTFITFNKGNKPDRTYENHLGKEQLVCLYPVMIGDFDFKDFIKDRYKNPV